MIVKMPKDLVKAIEASSKNSLKPFGFSSDDFRWNKHLDVKLQRYGQKRIDELIKLIEPHEGIRGAKTIIKDCKLWISALNGKTTRPRSLRTFEAMLRQYLLESGLANVNEGRPVGPRLYEHDEERGVWFCYYVGKTEYHPAQKSRDSYMPAYTTVTLHFKEMGEACNATISFYSEDVLNKTVEESLATKGYIVETQEMWDEYCRRRKLFHTWVDDIGKQFWARGIATDDMDGNGKRDRDSWYWHRTQSIQMDKADEPTRVVIDVFKEDDSDRGGRRRYGSDSRIDKLWWIKNKAAKDKQIKVDEDGDDECWCEDENTPEWDEVPDPDVPIHPMMAVFDMGRHLRLRIDVGQLTEYKYDIRLGDKLILPSDSRNLVEMLLAHSSQFRDIVKGKSGGAIILCAGIPGTGKTLTAEVYAEVMAKPLYTVQASQLGTDSDALEGELLKTFSRAARWGAILLLDEADVYVHRRGNDLDQNAIVGVFLRVLEYYKGVLFLTTNRSDLVDDAIASRCVARIDYDAPSVADQKAIWRILADTAQIEISDDVIAQVAERYPKLTGRDVKNLLKLANLVSQSRECEITLDIVRFVKRFKPTISDGEEPELDHITLPPMPTHDNIDANDDDEVDWKIVAYSVFADGAPHSASEAKDAVTESHPAIHPNAVTNALRQFIKTRKLERMDSGLYRLPQ